MFIQLTLLSFVRLCNSSDLHACMHAEVLASTNSKACAVAFASSQCRASAVLLVNLVQLSVPAGRHHVDLLFLYTSAIKTERALTLTRPYLSIYKDRLQLPKVQCHAPLQLINVFPQGVGDSFMYSKQFKFKFVLYICTRHGGIRRVEQDDKQLEWSLLLKTLHHLN